MSSSQLLLDHPFLFGLIEGSSGCNMDWKETPETHIFKFDLPGLTKDDVKLELHDHRVVHLSTHEGKKYNGENEDKFSIAGIKWHCKERPEMGNFCKEFRLPDDALTDQIKASMRDGVLEIKVLKDQRQFKKKLVKGNKHNKKMVDITFSGDDHDANTSPSPKGISRFVCCKA